jgi:hypothetical protein
MKHQRFVVKNLLILGSVPHHLASSRGEEDFSITKEGLNAPLELP